jgi:SpoVK/Ycf46/Vps4 family AAA+-type ATPase
MEYYSGVLFLTTNRVGDFDEAFTSRIRISLYYPKLNREKTGDVFRINLKMIEDHFQKNRQININQFKIGSFATDHSVQVKWNGRQIRNACQIALALAEYEAQGSSYDQILKPDRPDAVVVLKVEHFEFV